MCLSLVSNSTLCNFVLNVDESGSSVVRQTLRSMEGVQDSGKTGTDVPGRDMAVEEGTGKEIGGRRNENVTMCVGS